MHMYFGSHLPLSTSLPSSSSTSPLPTAPKCIYEHLFGAQFLPTDGSFPVDVHVERAHTLVIIMLLVLIVLLFAVLIFLLYFGRNFLVNVKEKETLKQDENVAISEHLQTAESSEKVQILERYSDSIAENTLDENLVLLDVVEVQQHEKMTTCTEDDQNSEDIRNLDSSTRRTSEDSKTQEQLTPSFSSDAVHDQNPQKTPTPEGTPKSTSSCISSEILTDSFIEEEEQCSTEQMTEDSSISRPSSLPMDFSTFSSVPFFNFTRKTPEFVPRMMLEEFESLDRSIEKRKMDIRDLLKRIQSAKRRHRRFSEHLQRVQIENHIKY